MLLSVNKTQFVCLVLNVVRAFRKIGHILVPLKCSNVFRIIRVIQNIYSDDEIIEFTIEAKIF